MLTEVGNGPPHWYAKCPEMAKQLEVMLYLDACSFTVYNDMSTLRQRLEQIAAKISKEEY